MRETRKSEKARRVPVPVRLLVPFVLVVLLAAAGNLLLCHLLVPSGRIGQAVEKLEREDHETLELGLSPETAGLHMREYYYLLQDVCRRHAPKELVLQYDPSVWTADDPADRESRVLLREMAFSKVKLSYARELFAGRHVRYLLFPWLWYLGGGAANEAAPAHCRTLEDSAGYEAQQAWFEKIVRYCREKNIVLTMVTVPEKRSVVLDNVDFYYEADRRMTALADESGFGYLDYLLSPSSGVSLDDSLFDSENGRLTKTAEADFRQTLSADLAAAAGRAPAVESRLGRVPDLMPEDGTWKVTQFGEARGKQEMFYAVTGLREDGSVGLVLIDGGWGYEKERIRSVAEFCGGRVDAWILTHPHNDHMTAFIEMMEEELEKNEADRIRIDRIYTTELPDMEILTDNAGWDDYTLLEKLRRMQAEGNLPQLAFLHEGDTLEVLGLEMKVLSAYSDYVNEVSNDLMNDGSLVFRLSGKEQSFLFCGDAGSAGGNKKLSKHIRKTFSGDMKSAFLQIAHHGFGGLSKQFCDDVDAATVFFDAPDWLLSADGKISSAKNWERMREQGRETVSFLSAPNQVTLR